MIRLYTIGFSGKSAEKFFTLLVQAGVKKIIDTRINNVSQLSGFAKGADLKYFAETIAHMEYEHNVAYAPTKELLSLYRKKKLTWQEYEKEYIKLLNQRKVTKTDPKRLDGSCLLCSEHKPDHCHRRLLAEYLKTTYQNIEIIHLL